MRTQKNSLLLSLAIVLSIFLGVAGAVDIPAYMKHDNEKKIMDDGNAVENYYYGSAEVRIKYAPAHFPGLLKMKCFSRGLIREHFSLYIEKVKRVNELFVKTSETPNKQFGSEFSAMKLHELYFSNLCGDGVIEKTSELYSNIRNEFGSYNHWKENFISTGMTCGEGWVILYRDIQTQSIFNAWVGESDSGIPAECTPLIVMDVFDHAYFKDFGKDREKYINVFMDNINWDEVNKRYLKK